MAATVAADTVAERLRGGATRTAALDALERHAAPIPTAAALAAAKALLELMSMDAAQVERGAYDRAGLLLARLHEEALPDIVAVYGSAFGDGGHERLYNSDSVLNVALRKPASQLTRADAASYACVLAYEPVSLVRGGTAPWAAAGVTAMQWFGLLMSAEPPTRGGMSKEIRPKSGGPRRVGGEGGDNRVALSVLFSITREQAMIAF